MTRKEEDEIIEILHECMGYAFFVAGIKKHGKPGEIVQHLSEEKRAKLSKLTPELLNKYRTTLGFI